MKKIYFIAFAALFAAMIISCGKENPDSVNPAPAGPAAGEFLNPVTLTFSSDELTKVSIDGEDKASWEEGDKIDIVSFDSEGTARKAEAVAVNATTGEFTATVESSDTYYAVYPSSDAKASEMLFKKTDSSADSLVVNIPSVQDGSLKNAIYYAAKTSSTAKSFSFKAVSGILKFQAAEEYTVAQIRNVENESDRDALHGVAACEFDSEGNLTVTPKHNFSSTHTINLDGSGTYYAAIVGNATNEFVLRFKQAETDYEPGVFVNRTVIFTPGSIKKLGNMTDRIHTDLYLSADGTGDGLSEETPASYSDFIKGACLGSEDVNSYVAGLGNYSGVWNCWRRDGITVHIAAGDYTSGFNVKGTGAAFKMTVEGVSDGTDTTKIQGLCTFEPAAAAHNTIKNLTFNSASGALLIRSGQWDINDCVFTECSGTNTVVVGSKSSTDDDLRANFRNCLFYKNTVPSYGVVKTAKDSNKGIIGFHNCRFESNIATAGNGAAIGSNGTGLAILLNKCTFIGNTNTTPANGYNIYMNGANTRFAMNSCTINSGGTKGYTNGSSVALKGQNIIANSTIWSSGEFGYWGLVALGCSQDNGMSNGALVINSVMRQNGTTYPAYCLNAKYYQNLNYCLHSGKDLTINETRHTVTNTLKVGSFASASAKTKVVDGITAYYYTWNYANTVGTSEFSKPTKDAVIEAIEKTGESTTDAKDGFGKLFTTWLSEVDETAFTKDLIGTDRPEGGLCPGSVEQAQ